MSWRDKNWEEEAKKEARKSELHHAHEAQKNWTKGQKSRVNCLGCVMFLTVVGIVGALVVFFINNPNGIQR